MPRRRRLRDGGYGSGAAAHSLDAEALGGSSGLESGTVIFDREAYRVFVETKVNLQQRRIAVAYGVGDGLLAHAK